MVANLLLITLYPFVYGGSSSSSKLPDCQRLSSRQAHGMLYHSVNCWTDRQTDDIIAFWKQNPKQNFISTTYINEYENFWKLPYKFDLDKWAPIPNSCSVGVLMDPSKIPIHLIAAHDINSDKCKENPNITKEEFRDCNRNRKEEWIKDNLIHVTPNNEPGFHIENLTELLDSASNSVSVDPKGFGNYTEIVAGVDFEKDVKAIVCLHDCDHYKQFYRELCRNFAENFYNVECLVLSDENRNAKPCL